MKRAPSGGRTRRFALLALWGALGGLCCVSAGFAQPVVSALVDRNQVTLEDQIRLEVTVRGTPDGAPVLPDLPDFRVVSAGNAQNMQIVNGQASRSITFNFILIPSKEGDFTIGPIEVSVGREPQTTRPIRVKVLGADEQPVSRDYFLRATVSNTSPYEGEQVLYTWRFYRRVEVANARLVTLEFGDMVAEDLGEVREYEATENGVRYVVSEIRKALFPQRAGSVTIPASEMSCQVAAAAPRRRRRSVFDDFFDRREMVPKTLRTAPIELQVRALPAAPAGFGGLVGDFRISSELSKRDLTVGESATLSLTVAGTGNAQMLSEPPLPELQGFKIYDDKPSSSLDRSGSALSGRKTYRKALVPLTAGEKVLPGMRLVFFDPDAGRYVTRSTNEIPVSVAPAAGEEELRLTEGALTPVGKAAVQILNDDILPIRTDLTAAQNRSLGGLTAVVLGAAAVAPPLLFSLILGATRRRQRLATDGSFRRSQQALRKAKGEISAISEDSECKYDAAVLAQRSSRCLREYIGDKLGAEGAALTLSEVSELLAESGTDVATARRVTDMLERFEAAQYASGAGPDQLGFDRDKITQSLGNVLRDLDEELKKVKS